jgi:hypothetical protein
MGVGLESAMARFPLILEILGHLQSAEVPLPGDADLRHGCQRALTAMMAALSRLDPAGEDGTKGRVRADLDWIQSPAAARLIDADQLQRFQQLMERMAGHECRHQ